MIFYGVNFESVQKDIVVDYEFWGVRISKREDCTNRFLALAGGKISRIDLEISWIDIISIFCEEAKSDMGPLSVGPLGADDDRHVGKALSVNWLDEEV